MPPQPVKTVDPLFAILYKTARDLESYVERLEKALVKYGCHKIDCKIFVNPVKCSCRFRETMNEILSKRGE